MKNSFLNKKLSSSIDFKRIAKLSDNSESVNALISESKWDELTNLLRLGKIGQLNISGKKMGFSIEYDGFFHTFVTHNVKKDGTKPVHGIEIGESLRELISELLKNEDYYVTFEKTFEFTVESLEGPEKNLVTKLSNDMQTSLNTKFIDRLVISGNFDSLRKSLKRLYAFAFNWNVIGTGNWFEIKYDRVSDEFVAYDFNNYDAGVTFGKSKSIKNLLLELHEKYVQK